MEFFTERKNNLAIGIYSKYTIREAVLKTIEDANMLFDQLYEIAEKGYTINGVQIRQPNQFVV